MLFKNASAFSGVLMLFVAAGCTSVVPKELADARLAYDRARNGPAAQVVPAELHKARESLALAEKAFVDSPDAQHTRDLAYVAERKTQLAEALAAQAIDNKRKAGADQDYKNDQAQINQDQKGQLAQAHGQLLEADRQSRAQKAQIGVEQQARLDAQQKGAESEKKGAEAEARGAGAEARAKGMMDNLARLAAVREEQRGLVITLSGSVLFASDKSTLLPDAQTRLDQVAQALMTTKERSLVIEGHTDSRGSESHNLDLSQRRAEAVRTYLIARGYQSDRIEAHGIGKTRPVSDNGNAEGRANNRRVEIVVTPQALGLSN